MFTTRSPSGVSMCIASAESLAAIKFRVPARFRNRGPRERRVIPLRAAAAQAPATMKLRDANGKKEGMTPKRLQIPTKEEIDKFTKREEERKSRRSPRATAPAAASGGGAAAVDSDVQDLYTGRNESC